MLDEASVRAVLNTIVDPCSAVAGVPAGIEEMGLVRQMTISQGPDGVTVQIRIGVTEPSCLMGFSFANTAQQRLEALPGVTHVEVSLDRLCEWDPADMSPDYQERLETFRSTQHAMEGGMLPARRPLIHLSPRPISST